jgi:hypothetical protein
MVQYYDVTAASGSRAVPSRGQMPETQNLKKKTKTKKNSHVKLYLPYHLLGET